MIVSNRTKIRPSRWWVALWFTATAVYAGLTVYTAATTEVATGWDVLLISLYLFTTALAGAALMWALTERAIARGRARFEAEQARRNTGTWTGPDGSVTAVRFSPREYLFYVTGKLSENWEIADREWSDFDTLAQHLTDLEKVGHVPADDEGTRSIRARLMLPGWDPDPDEVPV